MKCAFFKRFQFDKMCTDDFYPYCVTLVCTINVSPPLAPAPPSSVNTCSFVWHCCYECSFK